MDGAARVHKEAPEFPQSRRSLFRVWRHPLTRRILWHVYASVLVLMNIWLAHLAGELLDLYISAVELWAELAQKHLELTL